MSTHIGTPPQTDEEIAPILSALRTRCNDPLLDLRWNATAFVEKHASYDALGRPTKPVYAGRWQVIRYDTPRLADNRDFAIICTVNQPDLSKHYPIMLDRGAYTPIDWWLVDYMQLWDRAQGRLAEEMMKQVWAEHDKAEQLEDESAQHQEILEKFYREQGGGLYWMGGAQGKAHPETALALWGGTSTD